MSAAFSPGRDAEEATPPPLSRARVRVLLVLAAVVVWRLPWIGDAIGSDRTGAVAAIPLAGTWGLAAALLLARRRRALALGEAFVAFALAGIVCVLVATGHPWIPGPDRRAVLLPIFVPLSILALLDASGSRIGAWVRADVAAIRAGSALLASAALAVTGAWVVAGAALLLALLPAASALPRRARLARRLLEGTAFLLAAALLLAPEVRALVDPLPASAEAPTVAAFLHRLCGIGLGLVAAVGVALPEPPSSSESPPPLSTARP